MTDIEEDPAETPESVITPAWGRLHAWACGQRPGWDWAAVKAAMREAEARGAAYRGVADILWRLAWDGAARSREVLAELSYLNRTGKPKDPGPGPESLAALKAGDYATARRLDGTASVIPAQRPGTQPDTAEDDNQEGAGHDRG
jgi:hypothetical protein